MSNFFHKPQPTHTRARWAKTLTTLLLSVVMTACITTKRGESRDALALAQTALLRVEASGYVWQLVDPAAGERPLGLDKLLVVAQQKFDDKEYLEAKHIAERIVQAARLGLRQARDNRDTEPVYPE